ADPGQQERLRRTEKTPSRGSLVRVPAPPRRFHGRPDRPGRATEGRRERTEIVPRAGRRFCRRRRSRCGGRVSSAENHLEQPVHLLAPNETIERRGPETVLGESAFRRGPQPHSRHLPAAVVETGKSGGVAVQSHLPRKIAEGPRTDPRFLKTPLRDFAEAIAHPSGETRLEIRETDAAPDDAAAVIDDLEAQVQVGREPFQIKGP